MSINLCRFFFQRADQIVISIGRLPLARAIYTESFLKVDNFKRQQDFLSSKYSRSKNKFHDELVNKVKTSLEENQLDFTFNNLEDLLLLTKKTRDFDLLINATKFFIKSGHMPKNQIKGFGTNLMRLIYILDNPEIGIDLVKNHQDLEVLFGKCGYPYLILMNKLIERKEYQQVVELFDAQLPYFTEDNAKSVKAKNKLVTSIPYDQASLLLEALLYMNTKESFEKLKTVLDIFHEKNFKINNILFARAFLLAINQNDPAFALEFITRFKLENLDHSLARNLIIISLCQMNLVDDAMKLTKNLKNLVPDLTNTDTNKFVGKFFPMTIKHLTEVVEASKNAEYLEELEAIKNEENRIYQIDLKDYCKTG